MSTELTRNDLDELRALYDAVTADEWIMDNWKSGVLSAKGTFVADTLYQQGLFTSQLKATSNAAFIIAMHNALPALLDAANDNLRLHSLIASMRLYGQMLIRALERSGVDVDEDYWHANQLFTGDWYKVDDGDERPGTEPGGEDDDATTQSSD